ncbi:MAG: hypothetical protein KAW46_08825 [candidate division Zixibacteria bacterium]|nr:hypothetical protein [candidate division Zixibacteria bacterium]
MRKLSTFALILALLPVGCEKDEDEPITEQFVGTYRVYDPDFVGEKLDSVNLIVDENTRYQLIHYPERSGRMANFCSSSGIVDGFGTNIAVFRPQTIDLGNCDSMRVPRDTFIADFRNHGDTIWMDRDEDTLVYELRLR